MATLLGETWTGADGGAWPAAWQPQAEQSGTATLQGSAGRLVTRTGVTTAARQQTVGSLTGGDYDITVTITVPGGQAGFSIGIAWRADGTSDPAAGPGSRMFPLNGHSLRLDTNGSSYFYRHNNGSLTDINTTPASIGSWLGTGARRVRVQQVGTALRLKVWPASVAEPAIWALEATDPGAWTSGGKVSLGVGAGFNNAAPSTTSTAVFDDLVVAGGATDTPSPTPTATATPTPTASPTPTATTTTTSPPPPTIGTRRNWALMSAADQQAVISGLQRAKTSGAYDNLTRLHQQAMLGTASDWHGRAIFLPVHRWFLRQLETAMGVAMPYWDWVNRPFPTGLGGDGTAAQNYRVTSGPFASWVSVLYNSGSGTFSTRAGIIRRFGSAATSLPTAAQLTNVLNQTVYDASPWDYRAAGIRNWLEGSIGSQTPAMHNRVHEWVGGDMRMGTSPNDPVFWFHHANVDRIWAGWQTRRGVSTYAGPAGQGANDPMPLTGGVTPAQMFPLPAYDQLP
ncbi:Common central domain of tyrosinase [Friedmanniella luteola]|uniref:Common central domain of tyrosinase n=1 Tax=Friedmanniella luteola TaxID=546871 RepID=A0A1H1Q0J6_9ACTN|nr:tyrosinase family protein [Friedmanniella luteola]SDS16926.1 Common central domain of tyrosinase [Friedmanniella luteola]